MLENRAGSVPCAAMNPVSGSCLPVVKSNDNDEELGDGTPLHIHRSIIAISILTFSIIHPKAISCD